MKRCLILFLLALLALSLAACGGDAATSPTSGSGFTATADGDGAPETAAAAEGTPAEGGQSAEPAAETEDAAPVAVEISVRDYGVIRLELDPAAAPATVENFVKLAEDGFYDGVTFHRIIPGFVIQGGDPTGTGRGGSDVTIPGEFSANGFDNPIAHVKGVISMARATPYDSASSQFFITVADTPSLDGLYAAFGYVTEGMDVVESIVKDARPVDNNGTILPEEQPVMEYVRVIGD